MPDFLTQLESGPAIAPLRLLFDAICALALGFVVVLVYRRARAPSEQTPSFPPTLLLMTVLIAIVTQVVGNNTARAFSLVGTLSIVRFRTVVRDTLDTVFVIFAVTTGMAVGAGQYWLAIIGLAVVALALFLIKGAPRNLGGTRPSYLLTVRVAVDRDVTTTLEPVLDTHLTHRRLVSICSAKKGAAIDRSFEVHMRPNQDADAFVRAVCLIEGVMSADLMSPEAPDRQGDH